MPLFIQGNEQSVSMKVHAPYEIGNWTLWTQDTFASRHFRVNG